MEVLIALVIRYPTIILSPMFVNKARRDVILLLFVEISEEGLEPTGISDGIAYVLSGVDSPM